MNLQLRRVPLLAPSLLWLLNIGPAAWHGWSLPLSVAFVCNTFDPQGVGETLLYHALKNVSDAVVALDGILVSGAWVISLLRDIMVDALSAALLGGPGQVGLLPALTPLYLLMVVIAIALMGLFVIARYAVNYNISSLGRIGLIIFLAVYLGTSGPLVIRGYDRFRSALGGLFYNLARGTLQTALTVPGGGGEPIDLSQCESLSANSLPGSDYENSAPCNGYGLTLAFLYYTDRNTVFTLSPSVAFYERYYLVNGINYSDARWVASVTCTDEANVLLDQMKNGLLRALQGILLGLMGLLEQLIWFMLTLGVMALFIALAIRLDSPP